jgi:O-acetyl-ADP-ribose deacetylase
MTESFLNGRVVVKVGDLTLESVDAIVNAANPSLMGGGGVDGAIHRAGGAEILDECKAIIRTMYPQGLPTGEAVITTGGRLAAPHVIHTVGPVYGHNDGRDADLLTAAYRNSLALASKHGLRSIAFPSISTGVYSYPKSEAAIVSSKSIRDFATTGAGVSEIRLVFHSLSDAEVFLQNHVF